MFISDPVSDPDPAKSFVSLRIRFGFRIRIRNTGLKSGYRTNNKHHRIHIDESFFSRFEETKEPYRCCGKEMCMSLSERVQKLLDPEILEVQISLRYRDRADNSDLKPEAFRFVAYRNLFILTYGRTRAKMERKPLPSCLVMRVRMKYPDPRNEYTGFKAKKKRRH
jgi:hypothetical protein